MQQFLTIDDSGRATTESQVERLPSRLSTGSRAWEIMIDGNGLPVVAGEVTIDTGTLTQETRQHVVSLNGVDIGSGAARNPVK